MSRILSGVGVLTLCVAACNDKDISLINPGSGGDGGSSQGNAGNGGSTGVAGQGGSGTGGSAGVAGGGGTATAGSAGQGNSAGSGGEAGDAGTDSGPPPGPYTDICERYCAARTAWATATTDAGVNCAGWDSAGCQATCEGEFQGFHTAPTDCPSYVPLTECNITANVWFCQDSVVYANNCEMQFCLPADCDNACNAQARDFNTCLVGSAICTAP